MINPLEEAIKGLFHVMYYNSDHTWQAGFTRWQGVPLLQNPLDMWIKQEIIWETGPSLIIETGSAMGGSALFYVAVAPKIKVLSIDTQEKFAPSVKHHRITFLKGSSTDSRIVKQAKAAAKGQRVMVILDSDHEENHVFREMEIYSDLVSPKCYMVVEDTNLGGNPVVNTCVPGRGPMGAVERFMGKDDRFEIDKGREKFFMTFYPNGWLRRKDK